MGEMSNRDALRLAHKEAGILFEQGKFQEAFHKYRALAESGSVTAQIFIGWMYEVGRGVIRDLDEAGRWYRRAAEAGSPLARFHLALLCIGQEQYAAALEWLNMAADQNYAPALFRLAHMYRVGLGVHQNRHKAYEYYGEAARLGHLFAQRAIAGRMIRGELGFTRIPKGLFFLIRILWSAWRLASRDPDDDRLRR